MQKFQAVDYIVTGGSGFIGTHLLLRLLDIPETGTIFVFDIKPPRVEHAKIVYLPWDIRTPLSADFNHSCAICFHLAALCKEPGFDWDAYFQTNYAGTRNVCDLLSRTGTKTAVFASTMMVYRAGEGQMDEDSLTSPDTAYGISKLLAEQELARWQEQDKTRTLKIARPGVVFGRGEGGNFTRMYYALRRNVFAFIGKKTTIKGCVYVKDVVECLIFLARESTPQSIYNLVLPEKTTAEYICGCFFDVFQFRSYVPTIPYPFALVLGFAGEALQKMGMQTDLHHRRIQKLFYSTNISVSRLVNAGFSFGYTLRQGLEDWRRECHPMDLY